MIKLAIILALIFVAFIFARRNRRLHQTLRRRRSDILDRLSEPPDKDKK